MEFIYIGDTWEFEYIIKDSQGQVIDLVNYNIRAAIKDSVNTVIKIGSSKVSGGSIEQITGDVNGILNLVFPKEKTVLTKAGRAMLEVEITSATGKRYTAVQTNYDIKLGFIDWDAVT